MKRFVWDRLSDDVADEDDNFLRDGYLLRAGLCCPQCGNRGLWQPALLGRRQRPSRSSRLTVEGDISEPAVGGSPIGLICPICWSCWQPFVRDDPQSFGIRGVLQRLARLLGKPAP